MIIKKSSVLLGCTTVAVAGVLALAGCAPSASAPADLSSTGGDAAAEEPAIESPYQMDYDPDAPVVKQLADGRFVQRTPSMEPDAKLDYQFNVRNLKADTRGCGSCHDDLEAALTSFRPTHVGVLGGYEHSWTILECITCHTDETPNWIGTIGPTIHSIHNIDAATPDASCANCHELDAKTGDYKLWEEVKYDYLGGITEVEDPGATFDWDQDYLSPEGMPKKNWLSKEYDRIRYDHWVNNDPLDESMLDTWEITISGEVNEEKTWTVRELMEEAPSVTMTMVQQCEINPLGGDIIGQAEVTGVPLSWVLEQAGVTPDAVAVTCKSPNGEQAGYYGVRLDVLAQHEAVLAYEINGEPLSWMDGYPMNLYFSGITGSRNAKSFSEIIVTSENFDGQGVGGDKTTLGVAKPNVGILNTEDGQIIEAGKPYTIEGWANAWEDPMIGVEFSLDNGATWKRFDVSGSDTERWVHWNYTFTPEAGVDTAYVVQVRGVCLNEDGTTELYTAPGGKLNEVIEETERTTKVPLKLLLNAKTDMSSIEVTD